MFIIIAMLIILKKLIMCEVAGVQYVIDIIIFLNPQLLYFNQVTSDLNNRI